MSIAAPAGSRALALVMACHPVPTVGVTTLVTVLAIVVDNTWQSVLLIALAVLAGQLSIGWSNDLIDAGRDTAVHRSDKPLAAGTISRGAVTAATSVAAAATVPLSLALGWRAGVVHLVAVGSGWTYNLLLKSTVLSVLPYVVTFGLLPAVATLPLPAHPWPPLWVLAAGGLIGVAAHFGNVVPDLDEDAAAGVRGLPHRVGREGSGVAACVAALATIAVILAGQGGPRTVLDWVVTVVAVALAAGALAALRRNPHSEAAFYGSMAIAALGIVLIATSGSLR
jgi:4-hydroxybenzoate polyprenyltransferase